VLSTPWTGFKGCVGRRNRATTELEKERKEKRSNHRVKKSLKGGRAMDHWADVEKLEMPDLPARVRSAGVRGKKRVRWVKYKRGS